MVFHDGWFNDRLKIMTKERHPSFISAFGGIDDDDNSGTFPEDPKKEEYRQIILKNIYGIEESQKGRTKKGDEECQKTIYEQYMYIKKLVGYILPTPDALPPLFDSLLYCEWLSQIHQPDKWYRDHFMHAAKVALLGDWFLRDMPLQGGKILKNITNLLKENVTNLIKNGDLPTWLSQTDSCSIDWSKVIKLSWWIAGLFHDIGYPLQLHYEIGEIIKSGFPEELYSFGSNWKEVEPQIHDSLFLHLNNEEDIAEAVGEKEHGAMGAVHLLILSKQSRIHDDVSGRLALELAANALFNHHRIGNKLFSIELEFQSYLDNGGVISENLLKQFEDKKVPLSQKAKVSIEDRDRTWIICDDDNRKTYIVIKIKDKLNIYNDSSFSFCDDPISYLLMVADNCQEWGRLRLKGKNEEGYIKLCRYLISPITEISPESESEWRIVFYFKERDAEEAGWKPDVFEEDKIHIHSKILKRKNGTFPRIEYGGYYMIPE